jgi:hypothetical protein
MPQERISLLPDPHSAIGTANFFLKDNSLDFRSNSAQSTTSHRLQRTHHEICAKQGPNNEFLAKGVPGIGEPIEFIVA